jgi:branched-chain amino acid transport system permease protein
VSLSTLAQALASGVMLGCFYALVALGFAMILALTHSLNLAHGELVTLGGYVGYAAWAASGLHPLLLLPIAAAALLPLAFLWQWMLARLPEPRALPSLALTFGLALALQSVMQAGWPGPYRLIVSPALDRSTRLGAGALGHGRLAAALVALLAVGALWLGVTRTRWGRAIRATGLDREAAALQGIDADAATRAVLLLAMALTGAAGVLFATLHYLYPAAGAELTLLAIVLAIWAGAGRLPALLLAGLAVGVVESLTVAATGPAWREPAVAALLLLSLLARPLRHSG